MGTGAGADRAVTVTRAASSIRSGGGGQEWRRRRQAAAAARQALGGRRETSLGAIKNNSNLGTKHRKERERMEKEIYHFCDQYNTIPYYYVDHPEKE